jgi:hypothetical protein
LGWLLLQVTVCPVVGFSVGVQAARAGAAGQQSAAAASAKAEALERRRARKSSGALTICRGANRSDKDADRIIDVSRPGICEPARLAIRDNASQCRSTYHCDGDADAVEGSRRSVFL